MGAARLPQSEELTVERSNHGPLFDSFSESREGSRKGAARESGQPQGAGVLGSALERVLGSSWGRGAATSTSGNAGPNDSAKWRAGRSLHSGLEFYRTQQRLQRQQEELDAEVAGEAAPAAPQRRLQGGSVGAGSEYQPQRAARPEGSVSRHRGANFYAEAATRWRTAVQSGDPRAVAELARTEAAASLEDTAQQPAAEAAASAGVFFDFPETGGASLPPRWCHAAASMGERLYVYGGISQGQQQLSDIHFFSITTSMWRRLHVAAGSRKGGPPALCGHAIAASDGKIWVAGGRTGRKLHRRTFCLDTETLAWSALKDSQHAPVGVADLSLTAVGEHGVVAFGGLDAKAASSQLALLDPAYSTWRSLTTIGAPPSARGQHTAVWDGDDLLIVVGGIDGEGAFAQPRVHVLSLSRQEWSAPAVQGGGPGPRARHSAAMLGHNGARTMALFGGRSPQGTLLNDVWLLDVASWRWVRGSPLGASPTGREGAAGAVLAGSRIALCGGLSGAGPLDSLLLLSGDFGPELGPLAAAVSMARASSAASAASSSTASGATHRSAPAASRGMAGGSATGPAAAAAQRSAQRAGPAAATGSVRWADTASGGAAADAAAPPLQPLQGGSGVGGPDLAAVQLTEMLRRRNVAEAAAEAGRRAELAERLFAGERHRTQCLQAEVAQLRLVAAEAEQAAGDGAAALRDETRRAARDQGLMRAELASANQQIEDLKAGLASAKGAASQADRYREAAVNAAARERAACDAATAAAAQCHSLRRRCNDLAARLHAQRSSAAVAAAQLGPVRHVSASAAEHTTAAAAPVIAPGTGRPATPPAAAGIRLHSIGEDAAGEASTGSSPDTADAAYSPSGNLQLRVRTDAGLAAAAAAPAAHGDAVDATPPSGDADMFVASLDSAFERWSMGGAATPPPQAAEQQQTDGGGSSGMLQGAQASSGGRMLRARSAPEAAIVEASPPLSPSARQLARALQAARQQQAARPEQGGWPSRHGSVAGGGAAFTAPPSPLGRRNSLDASDMTLREAEAALAAERERAARLGAMLAARQQAAGERLAALERRVACLLGDADALAACTAAELDTLEQELHAGMAAIRRAVARAAAREAAAEGSTCSLCMERPQGVVFGCGHQVCADCSRERCPQDCPFCREPIITRINLFRS